MIPKIFQKLTYWPTYLLFKLLFSYRVEGYENLKGLEDSGVIFASNHSSYIDGPFSAAAMPRDSLTPGKFFPIRFLVAKEYCHWNNPFPFPLSLFTAAYVKINGPIPVTLGLGDLKANLFEAVKVVKNGGKLWIYPEGRITRDGKLGPGKKGAAYLHQETGAPIVPVGIIGSYKILSWGGFLGKNRVKIKIGKPIYSLNPELEEGTKEIMAEIAKLL